MLGWRASEIARCTGGRLVGPDVDVSGAGIDTRSLGAGSMFVALSGERDGHDFVDKAIEAGSVLALVQREIESAECSQVVVPDAMEALVKLGAAARDRLDGATVVGITGSVGKTSTKDLLAATAASTLSVSASEKSFNNEIGVPLTLVNANNDAEMVVVEMGARGKGHIADLTRTAKPNVGVVTAVGMAHVETFGSIEGVRDAKAELVESLDSTGLAVLNYDDEMVRSMRGRTRARVVTFSGTGNSDADVYAVDASMDTELRPSFLAITPWGKCEVVLPVRGMHQIGNALAAMTVALDHGMSIESCVQGLSQASLSPWRMEVHRLPSGGMLINDSYNANPTSMRAALNALSATGAQRCVAVLGEMAELGSDAAAAHAEIAAYAEHLGLELIAFRTDAYGTASLATIDDVVTALASLGEHDAVLLKGSRVAGLETIAKELMESS